MQLYYTDEKRAFFASELISIIPDSSAIYILAHDQVSDDLFLLLDADSLWLYSRQFNPFNINKFYTDFINNRKHGLHRENLLQAINFKVSVNKKVTALDLTAGFGRDSILMSLYGYQVTMVENNPYLALILSYLCKQFSYFVPGLKLVFADNLQYLESCNSVFDLVYLDPMFQEGKNALAKKDMQLISLCLLEAMPANQARRDNKDLFELSRKHCINKLIIKRDNKQATLISSPKPTYSKTGKTVRFDVYQQC
jgi:16S rRNA G966 N2-methylase RsmD